MRCRDIPTICRTKYASLPVFVVVTVKRETSAFANIVANLLEM